MWVHLTHPPLPAFYGLEALIAACEQGANPLATAVPTPAATALIDVAAKLRDVIEGTGSSPVMGPMGRRPGE